MYTQPSVPSEIEAEFGEQLAKLASFGYTVSDSLYSTESFGNWLVDLAGPVTFRVVKDRSQYFVDGDRESVAEYGLWRAFNELEELSNLLMYWAASAAQITPSGSGQRSVERHYLLERLCVELGLCAAVRSPELVHGAGRSPMQIAVSVLEAEGLDAVHHRDLLHRVFNIAVSSLEQTNWRSV